MTMTKLSRRICEALICGALTMAASAAHGEEGQMHVDVSGLDLATPQGAQTALRRIERLSEAFCDGRPGRITLERRAAVAKCRTAMTDKAVGRLNAPLVSALRQGRPTAATQVAAADARPAPPAN